MSKVNPVGRPTKRTPEIEGLLRHAFALGSTTGVACFSAGIAESTFYSWTESDPEFMESMYALKNKPVLKALQTVTDSLDDPKIATWYLEKRHEDFKPKQDVDVNVSGELSEMMAEAQARGIERAKKQQEERKAAEE